MNYGKQYEYKGFKGNLRQVCEHFGKNYYCVAARIKKGMSLSEAMERGNYEGLGRKYTIAGRSQNASAWSKEIGITTESFLKRWEQYERGKMVEDKLLSAPAQRERVLSYRGESHRICEWAKILGIRSDAMDSRVRRYEKGRMEYERMFEAGAIETSQRPRKMYMHNGIRDTAEGWGKRLGITTRRFVCRMTLYRRGLKDEDSVFVPNRMQYETGPNGQRKSITEWARECGVAKATMIKRFGKWRSGELTDDELLHIGIEPKLVPYKLHGKSYTVEGLCRRLEISPKVLSSRIALVKKGKMAVERLFTRGKIDGKDREFRANKRYELKDGTKVSLLQLAELAGINFDGIVRRLKQGMSIDEIAAWAKDPYRRIKGYVFFRGKKETLDEAVKSLGITGRTVNSRIHQGWAFEDAVSTRKVLPVDSQKMGLESRKRNRRIRELKKMGVMV